jgi:hypothetical protein
MREHASGHAFAFNGNIANAGDIAVKEYPEQFSPEILETLLDTKVLQSMVLGGVSQ